MIAHTIKNNTTTHHIQQTLHQQHETKQQKIPTKQQVDSRQESLPTILVVVIQLSTLADHFMSPHTTVNTC